MGWIIRWFIGAIIGGFAVTRIAESLLFFVSSGVMSILSPILFTSTSTAVMTKTATNKWTSKMEAIEKLVTSAGDKVDSNTKSK
jgi:hypothetical protein